MVLHDQRNDLSSHITALDQHLNYLGFHSHAIHTGPLIRRESVYIHDLMENRKRLFNALFHFTRKAKIRFCYALISKRTCSTVMEMTSRLSREIANILKEKDAYFQAFDEIIIYYDNGQTELSKILISVFNALFPHVTFRRVCPADYKLFQAADLICTLKLLSLKAADKSFSRSENEFFHSPKEFLKTYWKPICKKAL